MLSTGPLLPIRLNHARAELPTQRAEVTARHAPTARRCVRSVAVGWYDGSPVLCFGEMAIATVARQQVQPNLSYRLRRLNSLGDMPICRRKRLAKALWSE